MTTVAAPAPLALDRDHDCPDGVPMPGTASSDDLLTAATRMRPRQDIPHINVGSRPARRSPHGITGDAPFEVTTLTRVRCAAPIPYVGPAQHAVWDAWVSGDGRKWLASPHVHRVTDPDAIGKGRGPLYWSTPDDELHGRG